MDLHAENHQNIPSGLKPQNLHYFIFLIQFTERHALARLSIKKFGV